MTKLELAVTLLPAVILNRLDYRIALSERYGCDLEDIDDDPFLVAFQSVTVMQDIDDA